MIPVTFTYNLSFISAFVRVRNEVFTALIPYGKTLMKNSRNTLILSLNVSSVVFRVISKFMFF